MPDEASPEAWWKLRPIGIAVVVVGLVITGVLSWVAVEANNRSSSALLALQARLTASALSGALPAVQSQLADALTVATATNSPSIFTRFVADNVDRSKLVSESLWERTGHNTTLLATAGSEPELVREGDAAAFFATVQPKSELQVTGILAGSPPRLGYAEYPPGASRYIVYAESRLPASKHLVIPKASPYAQLNFALYLGHKLTSSNLIESSVPTPVKGEHAVVSVPFGNTVLTLVASPRTALAPGASEALPWIAGFGGSALTIIGALLVGYLSRRRRLADELNLALTSLYSEQRSIAETLQHSLLPGDLPTFEGMEIAARYWPGAQGVDIGGDWYDIIPLDEQRFVFIVGDVSGRGIRAAAVMASIRFASRGFALEGHAPAVILKQLAKTLDLAVDGHFATVLCGRVDIGRHEVTVANAGHLPPVLVSDGSASVLAAPPIPPIGVATSTPAEESIIQLPSNALLLAYTDGLVERRGETLEEAIGRLRHAAMRDSTSVDALLASIISDLTMNAPTDDVALLGIKWTN